MAPGGCSVGSADVTRASLSQRWDDYGGAAARYQGEPGPVPGDVDVLVVGETDRDDVYDAADRASTQLHREVNPSVVSVHRWSAPEIEADPFIRGLRERPLVQLYPVVEREDH